MAWTQNKVAVYERMIVELRRLITGETADVEWVPPAFLADLDQIITTTEIAIAGKHSDFGVPTEADLARPAAKLLARWLWDRNLTVHDVAHTTDRVVVAAGATDVLPQSWVIAAHLMSKMEARAESGPDSPTVARHHLNDRAQWVGLPAVAPKTTKATEAPADPFRHGSTAEANRLAKAKQLARWLWDRGIDGAALLGFTDKYRREIARAAGVNPPSSLTTWNAACGLMAKMEAREAVDPHATVVIRHCLDEHEQWAADPHAAKV